MAAIEPTLLNSSTHSTFNFCSSLKSLLSPKPQYSSIKLQRNSTLPCKVLTYPSLRKNTSSKLCFEPCMCTAVQEASSVQEAEKNVKNSNGKKKLFVANLPWSYDVTDIKNLFSQCGTVKSVELIKRENKLSKGFAFVTMASGEEAQAVVDKFDSQEVSGRKIKVEFSKRLNKTPPQPPSQPPPRITPGETIHKIYVSNIQWKVRSRHLREFFSENFSPVSARVVFDSPSGKSAGYGFVSFATKEEAENAISALNGKELMGRAVRLRFSQKNEDESGSKLQDEGTTESQ